MKKAIVILGKAGSGKSTVGESVAQRLGWHYVSTGKLARESIGGKWQEKGEMAPETKIRELFEVEVSEHSLVVIDGMPRKPEQVAYIDSIFDEVFYYEISIDDATAKERLLERGRADDTESAITKRLSEYGAKTSKAIEKAQKAGHHVKVLDGTMPVEWLIGDVAFERRFD